MTHDEMRIAIAEACGWSEIKSGNTVCPSNLSGVNVEQGKVGDRWGVPDYCNDLNAMHDAEKILDQTQARSYADHLAESEQDGTWASCHMWHQSAAQRAEAFCRTLYPERFKP